MRRINWLAASLLALAACKTNPPATTPIKTVATLEEVMHHMVIPNAQVVWKSVGTVYTNGKTDEIQPRNDEEWLAVEAASTILTESGNLLMMDGRAKDQGHWIDHSKALREAGTAVHEAAKARNATAVFERGGQLFEACQACHFEYRFKKDPNTMRTH